MSRLQSAVGCAVSTSPVQRWCSETSMASLSAQIAIVSTEGNGHDYREYSAALAQQRAEPMTPTEELRLPTEREDVYGLINRAWHLASGAGALDAAYAASRAKLRFNVYADEQDAALAEAERQLEAVQAENTRLRREIALARYTLQGTARAIDDVRDPNGLDMSPDNIMLGGIPADGGIEYAE